MSVTEQNLLHSHQVTVLVYDTKQNNKTDKIHSHQILVFICFSSSSVFTAKSLAFAFLGDIYEFVTFFVNTTIE